MPPLTLTHCVRARREVVSRADAANRLGVSPLSQASLRPSEGHQVSVRQDLTFARSTLGDAFIKTGVPSGIKPLALRERAQEGADLCERS